MILCPLRYTQRDHKGAVIFDLEVRKGVEESRFRDELLLHGVRETDGAGVGP